MNNTEVIPVVIVETQDDLDRAKAILKVNNFKYSFREAREINNIEEFNCIETFKGEQHLYNDYYLAVQLCDNFVRITKNELFKDDILYEQLSISEAEEKFLPQKKIERKEPKPWKEYKEYTKGQSRVTKDDITIGLITFPIEEAREFKNNLESALRIHKKHFTEMCKHKWKNEHCSKCNIPKAGGGGSYNNETPGGGSGGSCI